MKHSKRAIGGGVYASSAQPCRHKHAPAWRGLPTLMWRWPCKLVRLEAVHLSTARPMGRLPRERITTHPTLYHRAPACDSRYCRAIYARAPLLIARLAHHNHGLMLCGGLHLLFDETQAALPLLLAGAASLAPCVPHVAEVAQRAIGACRRLLQEKAGPTRTVAMIGGTQRGEHATAENFASVPRTLYEASLRTRTSCRKRAPRCPCSIATRWHGNNDIPDDVRHDGHNARRT